MTVRAAFELKPVTLKLSKLLATRQIGDAIKNSEKYKTIAASIAEIKVVEPIVVHKHKGGAYSVLDGHIRLDILRDMGFDEAECLVAKDDEGHTYNTRVQHLSPIQANRMLVRALDEGVPADRLSRALNLARNTVCQSKSLLKGICPEALELLKDKPVTNEGFRVLKKVQPMRQIEMAELMIASANYTKPYSLALLAATPDEQLAHEEGRGKKTPKMRIEDITKMEAEMQSLERDVLLLDESYGRNVVNLTIARGYLKKLMENAKVVKYLAAKYSDLLAEFQRIQEAASLEA